MGLFDHFPYTNVHELNLDWILSMMKALEAEWEAFTAGNSLTFADPLQHDISKTYAKNTIVLDADGNAYVSLQAVPVGVALGNQDYWLMVFDYEAFIEKVNKNFTVRYYRNQYRATAAMAIGDWLTVDDILCKATAAIAVDDILEIGVNIEHFTLEDFIKAFMYSANQLIQQYKNDIDASELLYRQQLAQDIANTTASLQAQLDAAISGVTVDSEVINARVGADGITYGSLGDANRSQFTDLKHAYRTSDTGISNLYALSDFHNGDFSGLTVGQPMSNFFDSTIKYRITNDKPIYIGSDELRINIAVGFKLLVRWSDASDDFVNQVYYISAGEYLIKPTSPNVYITIARATEDITETATIDEFVSAVTFINTAGNAQRSSDFNSDFADYISNDLNTFNHFADFSRGGLVSTVGQVPTLTTASYRVSSTSALVFDVPITVHVSTGFKYYIVIVDNSDIATSIGGWKASTETFIINEGTRFYLTISKDPQVDDADVMEYVNAVQFSEHLIAMDKYNAIFAQNISKGVNTFNNLVGMSRGSWSGTTGYPPTLSTQNYRVATKQPLQFDVPIKIYVKSGFKWYGTLVDANGNMTASQIGWKYPADNGFVIDRGTRFYMNISKEPQENYAELLDYSNAVTFTYVLEKHVEALDARVPYTEYNPLYECPFIYHAFVGLATAQTSDIIIPALSLPDFETAYRTGHKVIEINVGKTSDDKYFAIHLDGSGKAPQLMDLYGVQATFTMANETFNDIKSNYVYRSSLDKYQIPPTSLEEALNACKTYGLIPMVDCSYSTDVIDIVKSIVGNKCILYRTDRKTTDAFMAYYDSTSSTVSDVLTRCATIGAPLIYGITNPETFSDADLADIIAGIHDLNCIAAFPGNYKSTDINYKMMSLGFDVNNCDMMTPAFTNGNVASLADYNDFDDFSTDGTVANGVCTLQNGETLYWDGLETLAFGKSCLIMTFTGTLTIVVAGQSHTFTSDGRKAHITTAFYFNDKGDFYATSTGETVISSIQFNISKC